MNALTRSEAPADRPLILTLRLDTEHQIRFDDLRRAYFPPDRNHLAAHITLFHQLPAVELPRLVRRLQTIVADMSAPDVAVEDMISLGRGVAFRLRSAEVEVLRCDLVTGWTSHLSRQDRHVGRLHVTVQNKVAPNDARGLLRKLEAGFSSTRFKAPGLDLWRYLGGPWQHLAAFDFTSA